MGLRSKACIMRVPIFNHLDDEKLEEIMSTIKTAHFEKGEIVYRAGQQSDSLYIVSKGKIRIYRLSESGREQLLRILKPGILRANWHCFGILFMNHLQKPWKKLMYV